MATVKGMKPEYAIGARNAVEVCLGINSADRVCIIQDTGRIEIAGAVAETAERTGAAVRRWTMEDYGSRPLREFPRRLAEEISAFSPTASFYIGGSQPGELAFRKPMRELLVEQLRCRHGHMVGIEPRVMVEGMAADYEEIYRVTRRVYEIVRQAGRIEVATSIGTELVATFSPNLRWVPCDGRYREPGRWGNLPEGECFTCPLWLDGLLVGESMGDHFSEKYGLFQTPVRLHVKRGRVRQVEVPGDPALESEIRTYLAQASDSDRAGEFAIGTNVGLTSIIGNFLQDEKFPGVHVAFGDPYGAETGADWSCPSHVDVLASHADITVDGARIMEKGRFLV